MLASSVLAAVVHRRRRVTPALAFSFDALGASFARTGVAAYYDAAGLVESAATDVLRNAHYINGRRTILLEPSRQNLITQSDDFSAWVAASATITPNAIAAPDGTLTADLIQSTVGTGGVYFIPTYTADGVKVYAVFLKQGTAAQSRLTVRDQSAAINRHNVNVTWSGGTPTLSTIAGTGTLFTPEDLGDGWWRLLIGADGIVAANVHRVLVIPDTTGNGTVYAWRGQTENAAYPTSAIGTAGGLGTRNAETLSVAAVQSWQAMTFYARIPYEAGTGFSAGTYFALKPSAASPVISINRDTSGNYRLSHNNGSTTVHGAVGSASTLGAIVEIRGIVYADGSVQAGISINGGAESVGAQSAANAFSATQPDRVEFGGVLNAPLPFSHFLVANGVRSLAQLRSAAGV